MLYLSYDKFYVIVKLWLRDIKVGIIRWFLDGLKWNRIVSNIKWSNLYWKLQWKKIIQFKGVVKIKWKMPKPNAAVFLFFRVYVIIKWCLLKNFGHNKCWKYSRYCLKWRLYICAYGGIWTKIIFWRDFLQFHKERSCNENNSVILFYHMMYYIFVVSYYIMQYRKCIVLLCSSFLTVTGFDIWWKSFDIIFIAVKWLSVCVHARASACVCMIIIEHSTTIQH